MLSEAIKDNIKLREELTNINRTQPWWREQGCCLQHHWSRWQKSINQRSPASEWASWWRGSWGTGQTRTLWCWYWGEKQAQSGDHVPSLPPLDKWSEMSGWRSIMSDVNYGISNVGTVMTSCAGTQHLPQYHGKLERVKFGVSLDQVCRPDLPGPLLVSNLQHSGHFFMFAFTAFAPHVIENIHLSFLIS